MEPVWVQMGDKPPVKIVHEDTLKRVLSEGWQIVSDPALSDAPPVATPPDAPPAIPPGDPPATDLEVNTDAPIDDGNPDRADAPVDRRSGKRDATV